jgi:hypothetical protein
VAFALNIAFFYESLIEIAFALEVLFYIELLGGETTFTYITIDRIGKCPQELV